MRTKTLLLTAALGLAAAATTVAQVYSVNAVGYVNVTFVKGWNLFANPLQNQTDNSIKGLFGDMPALTTIYKWTGTKWDVTVYYGDGEWDPPTLSAVPGEGIWVFIPADGPATVKKTFVGEVLQGDASNMQVKAGFQLLGSKVPQAGKLVTDLKFPADTLDTIYQWDPAAQKYKTAAVHYGDNEWEPAEPVIGVAEGFWSLKEKAANWVRNFSVNP
ncbi:MAG: hypothetical protein N3G20_03255 [Verrucomicrobiae bacterium]|nr:hypothetical protein [Verrucomicrobiae bacterium]